ncbi:hypothetical protein B9Z55_012853 [Caenorhabditis nigoni]|uniref:Uncharacterized protein n=1 Tax=Caenorhabditis nigoni TaxID=1611254 RepID=A0A2G5TZ61_9PELO|nr:hypothetical protein B9Z55_012853 [Caenorhabditis nigoni]
MNGFCNVPIFFLNLFCCLFTLNILIFFWKFHSKRKFARDFEFGSRDCGRLRGRKHRERSSEDEDVAAEPYVESYRIEIRGEKLLERKEPFSFFCETKNTKLRMGQNDEFYITD